MTFKCDRNYPVRQGNMFWPPRKFCRLHTVMWKFPPQFFHFSHVGSGQHPLDSDHAECTSEFMDNCFCMLHCLFFHSQVDFNCVQFPINAVTDRFSTISNDEGKLTVAVVLKIAVWKRHVVTPGEGDGNSSNVNFTVLPFHMIGSMPLYCMQLHL